MSDARSSDWWLVAVIVLALAVRALHCYQTSDMPFLRHLTGDALSYFQWAENIAGGQWLGDEAFYQAPLYPYVLAIGFTVLGAGVFAIRLIQVVLGTLAVACLGLAARSIFNARAGLIAAVMLAFYGPAIYFDGIVQKTSLGCFLLCALILGIAWTRSSRRLLRVGVVGILTGLMILTRENAMIWVPFLAVWLWTSAGGGARKERTLRVISYVAGLALVLLPIGVRNVIVADEWSVSTFQAGPNFYIGNSEGADGRYHPLVRGHETPAFERRDATQLAESATGRELSAREVSRYWMSRAVSEIKADPGRWLRLMGIKNLMVWNAYEVSDVESLYIYAEYSPVLRVLISVWHFGVLAPLAAVGIMLTWKEWRRLWIYYALTVSMAFAVALFYILARYRFPLVPLLIPFAAAGCVGVWDRLRSRQYGSLLAPAIVALTVAIVVNWPVHDERRLNAMAYSNLGSVLGAEGDLEAATHYLRLAVEGHPQSAEAHFNLAYALSLQGRPREAVVHYRAALKYEPSLINADYLLAIELEGLGETDQAIEHYERAVELDPTNAEAQAALTRLRRD